TPSSDRRATDLAPDLNVRCVNNALERTCPSRCLPDGGPWMRSSKGSLPSTLSGRSTGGCRYDLNRETSRETSISPRQPCARGLSVRRAFVENRLRPCREPPVGSDLR